MPGPLASLLDRFGSRPGWVIAIDLLLVYYLIYRVLRAIRGTRAAQMAVGIALLAAGFYAARRLELVSVSWLLDNVLSYLILIVIVVFQADIRRALGRIGQGVMPSGRADDVGQVVDEVAAAVAQLARARRGAIIVLEREADLTGFVEDATRLDAALSRQLLVTLFVATADNELHDGAVVIGRNRRIAVARALLPLSRAAGLGPELGTRHRAALGITEDTDAIAVVVSEERGQVSVCFHGRVARDLDGQTLRRALLELYGGGGAAALAAAEVGAAVASLGRERALEGS
ncbi:MAG: diadenylate cyclase [Kofleriaceae bacterium]|jgi:diadenylate cyclase|nr:diadenylate cyclase [Kofleriaceae bacterium]MBP9172051.1 diadenylate cyclase [Kofleriaceae bacterium]MBP9861975.1 diadenylate cyclase [Kofleriaceae bacterium]